jgi:hypothetical protein
MSTYDQYILEVNTQKGLAGFTLYKNFGDVIDLSNSDVFGTEAGGTLAGFTKQEEFPNLSGTFTISVSQP